MVLLGTMNLTRTRATGDFYCPHCGCLREYRRRARRPFLTIYFIPVVPIGASEEFLVCSSCKTNSPLAALDHDERSFRQSQDLQFRHNTLQAAAMVVTADGTITEREIEALLELAHRLVPGELDRDRLGALCSSIRLNRVTPKNFIAAVSRPWSTAQRRLAFQVIFLAASADGQLDDVKVKLLSWLREQFGMSEKEYQNAIEEAVNAGIEVTVLQPHPF